MTDPIVPVVPVDLPTPDADTGGGKPPDDEV